mmetsp:Transcript_30484/g.29377  ORF Transcript_30484/g.29377 Transcript_30484/m.29377 type:complete len:84 (+) Transcript_30484:620-871(+)
MHSLSFKFLFYSGHFFTDFYPSENRITPVDCSNHTLLDASASAVNFLNDCDIRVPADQCLTPTFEDPLSDGVTGRGVIVQSKL